MCGICGLYGSESTGELSERVREMMRTIAHRGPDGEGVFAGTGVALGHRRLRVIDPSPAGAQPMTVAASPVCYDGDSYNFRDLRKEAERDGRRFRRPSDTDVLQHAYQDWFLELL